MINLLRLAVEITVFPFLIAVAFWGRCFPKRFDLGIGPDALISAKFHKAAAEKCGLKAETFCITPFYITGEFDRVAAPLDATGNRPGKLRQIIGAGCLLISILTRYKALFLTFNGGVLRYGLWLWKTESWLLKLAGIKVAILPYGSDVQDMSLSANLAFKHGASLDYPSNRGLRKKVRERVDYWSLKADHVIAGCDWVDYMHMWDTLMLAHFTIDTDQWKPSESREERKTLKVLHAPNHKSIKGTQWLQDAISELKSDGVDIELEVIQKVPNHQVKKMMAECDVIADQFVVGWYAQFALEGMAMSKPVLCYCREDLIDLFEGAGLLEAGELPIINCERNTLVKNLKWLSENRTQLPEIGALGRRFVEKHHSVEAMSEKFFPIFSKLNLPVKSR